MAEITLIEMWLHPASDLATSLNVALNQFSAAEPSVAGSSEMFANGNLRYVRSVGDKTTIRVALVELTYDDFLILKGWVGILLLYRDPKGRKLYGTFSKLNTSDKSGDPARLRSASLDLEQVTFSEEV